MYNYVLSHSLVSDAGGAEALVNLLSDESASSRQSATECIIAMSPSGKSDMYMHFNQIINIVGSLRLTLIQNGAMEGLARCLLHVDPKVLSSATQAIALLAVDSIGREKVGY